MLTLLSLLLLAAFVFVGIDLWFSFYLWQSRIHIGRWENRFEWQQAIESKAHKWLDKSPTVKISDNSRWVLFDMLRGKYRSNTIQSWQDAGLLMGFDEKESAQYASRKIDPKSGDWKVKPQHIDAALLAYTLKKNGSLPPKAEKTVLNLLLELKGEAMTVPYRNDLPVIRFVDTIGMITPFLSICNYSGLAKDQIEEYDRAKLTGSSIPSHAYDITRNLPLGIYDWSRGMGWYILGLVESNTEGRFNNRIVTLAYELLKYQKPGGGFGAMFFNIKSPVESSGTVLIGLLMVRSYQINHDPQFLEAAFKAERQLMLLTRRTGELDFCQGDTKGIGYYSHTFSIMPFAQGMALKLSKELNQYAHG